MSPAEWNSRETGSAQAGTTQMIDFLTIPLGDGKVTSTGGVEFGFAGSVRIISGLPGPHRTMVVRVDLTHLL